MSIRNFLALAVFCTAFFSCSSDELEETKSIESATVNIGNISAQNEGDILCFDSYEQFNQAVKNIKNSESIAGSLKRMVPLAIMEQKIPIKGFTSIYDSYEAALNEADKYYDTKNHYEEFKEKYSNLYFPEHEDDYSAYLPVSDENVAKLLNVNGEVEINGKIINMKDVSTYEELMKLGRTMEDYTVLKSDYIGNYINGFPELENGGNRRLKCRVYTQPGSTGVYEEIVVDISFRKKGAFGIWYNYSSTTVLGWVPGLSWTKTRVSSHDYKFAREYDENHKPVRFAGKMYVLYEGFRGDKVFFDVNI